LPEAVLGLGVEPAESFVLVDGVVTGLVLVPDPRHAAGRRFVRVRGNGDGATQDESQDGGEVPESL
jgi:hypothetical protein